MKHITQGENGKEIVLWSEYRRMYLRPSTVFPGEQIEYELGISCPRCGADMPSIAHAQGRQCKQCALHIERLGNSLRCW